MYSSTKGCMYARIYTYNYILCMYVSATINPITDLRFRNPIFKFLSSRLINYRGSTISAI